MNVKNLQRCQVETPQDVVDLAWRFACARRESETFESVLDLGAGDCRFARVAQPYGRYVGIEIDPAKVACAHLPERAQVLLGDAMASPPPFKASLSIGNPPFIKSSGLDPLWREQIGERFASDGGVPLKQTANLYVLFLMQALLRTLPDGLVVQVVPFEWVTRPSASELRDYIRERGWDVAVYRFEDDIFPRVLTTASITVIDKRGTSGQWSYGQIDRAGTVRALASPTGTGLTLLPYAGRDHSIYALRGLSPGGQDVFVLTEEQRLEFSLEPGRDVTPCVTSLRRVPADLVKLDKRAFEKHFLYTGARCWLIRSDCPERSPALKAYLASVGDRWKAYTTCTRRGDWAAYSPHPAPRLLVSSGFVGKGPKVLVNRAKAIAVGSVYGILAKGSLHDPETVAMRLREYDFRNRLVHHSNNLKKIEVRQLNTVLGRLFG